MKNHNVVIPDDGCQLFRIVYSIQLRTANHGDLSFHEILIRSLETAGEEFTEALWGSLVEKVTVYKDGFLFTLTCGREMKV